MIDVLQRFQALQKSGDRLNLYALVDGFQYEQHTGQRFEHRQGINRPIFFGTEDEPLAHAGPWLIDIGQAPELAQPFFELEQALPSVSWLITPIGLEGLSQLLQLKLYGELPDGRKVLVRFYDPRVLANLFQIMNTEQRAEFFHLIEEWHFIHDGRRVWAGRDDDQAR
jgi:hypothetical protein